MKRYSELSLLVVPVLIAALGWSPAAARVPTTSNDKPTPLQDAAGRIEIEIPGEGWTLSFVAPPLKDHQEKRQGDNYAFLAKAGRFNLSVFVEPPQKNGGSHKDCADYYWHLVQKNPAITDDPPPEISENASYVRVKYQAVVDAGPLRVHQANANYYFSFRGKWVDVHISVLEPTAEDAEIFHAFDRSLTYGP
jgi:hypothetical protein